MRICSLLPSATEIAFALGLGDDVVGVTHECDYPIEAKGKPVIVRSRTDTDAMSSAAVDEWVRTQAEAQQSVYVIDRNALAAAAPDLIVTQDLCDVCAVAADEVSAACEALPVTPRLISLVASSLAEVLRDIDRVGAATGRQAQSRNLVRSLEERIDKVRRKASAANFRPRVACLEWLDPIYSAGHWVPEMVAIAAGEDVLARPAERSSRIDWNTIANRAPEILIIMPCGFDCDRARQEAGLLRSQTGWESIPAVRANRVFAVDGHSYFNRPGPRLIDGLEILAHIIHPGIFPENPGPRALQRIDC
jgi:iron complex transport system substrate-binding protein